MIFAGAPFLASSTYFNLVDEVLVRVGREHLPAAGPQRAIIEVRPGDRILQVLAAAGSGKTEMLVWRVLYDLFVNGVDARRVLVTTFTRKAALELSVRMVERADMMMEVAREQGVALPDPHVHDLRIGTLHSMCDALLAEFDPGYMAAGTQLMDEAEARVRLMRVQAPVLGYTAPGRGEPKLVNRLLEIPALVALFRAPWLDERWPSTNQDRVSLLQALLAQQTETWFPRCAADARPNGIETLHSQGGLTADLDELRAKWEGYLDEQHLLDFATIQKRFFERQAAVVSQLDHIYVDEFQDTNPIQFAIHTGWLARPGVRLTVVGDDDQSIYRFRGSDIGCFRDLGHLADAQGINFRIEKLEENWRSSRAIVGFAEAYRQATVLAQVSMDKRVAAPASAALGEPPRLLEGHWQVICERVAAEVDALGAGKPPVPGKVTPSVGILLFSTSEKGNYSPASVLRIALEARGLRVYNPRNKTAAEAGSPVYELAALISYLIDPVSTAPIGRGGRQVEVWASHENPDYAAHALTVPPPWRVMDNHASLQKKFRKSHGWDSPSPGVAEVLGYLDAIRARLVAATTAGEQPRLAIAGLVARLLSFPYFRATGFSARLFREALFTQVLEANIAPTRLSRGSLDQPLLPTRAPDGRVAWPDEVWRFLAVLGAFVDAADMDDVEVDALAENAVAMLTFHQSKGLEFDHVYVGLTGRSPAQEAVLQTKVFSGEEVPYEVQSGHPFTRDAQVRLLAEADRDREVYVAITRARQHLTVLHAPGHGHPLGGLHTGLAELFEPAVPQPLTPGLTVREFSHA